MPDAWTSILMADDMTTDPYPNVGRASGYTDGQGRAVGEDLVNVVTQLVSSIETKLLLYSLKVDAALEKISGQGDVVGRNQIDLASKVNAWRHETDTRLNALADSHAEIDKKQVAILQAVQDGATRLGKLEAGQRTIDLRAKTYYEQNAARIDEVKAELARQGSIVDARPAQRLIEQQERLAWQTEIERRIADLEQQRLAAERHDGDGT